MAAIFNWFCANKLSLNATKTQYMVIQPPTKTFDLSMYNLIIDNVILTQTTSCKFLGMTIDESLSWKKHILNINSKLSRAIFVIKQVKFYLPKESLHTLYYSLLHPHITYGILAWGNAKASVLRKTQILQNRLRCPLTILSGIQCFNMGHNGHRMNLYVVVISLWEVYMHVDNIT